MSDFDGKFNYPDVTPYERLYSLNKELFQRCKKVIKKIIKLKKGIVITFDDLDELINILKGGK